MHTFWKHFFSAYHNYIRFQVFAYVQLDNHPVTSPKNGPFQALEAVDVPSVHVLGEVDDDKAGSLILAKAFFGQAIGMNQATNTGFS